MGWPQESLSTESWCKGRDKSTLPNQLQMLQGSFKIGSWRSWLSASRWYWEGRWFESTRFNNSCRPVIGFIASGELQSWLLLRVAGRYGNLADSRKAPLPWDSPRFESGYSCQTFYWKLKWYILPMYWIKSGMTDTGSGNYDIIAGLSGICGCRNIRGKGRRCKTASKRWRIRKEKQSLSKSVSVTGYRKSKSRAETVQLKQRMDIGM